MIIAFVSGVVIGCGVSYFVAHPEQRAALVARIASVFAKKS